MFRRIRMKFLYVLKSPPQKRFLKISESFGNRPRTPENGGECPPEKSKSTPEGRAEVQRQG